MGILGNNGAMIGTILRFLGVTAVQATTDTPDVEIHVKFTRYGKQHESTFKVQEVLSAVSQVGAGNRTGPKPGYTDLADLP